MNKQIFRPQDETHVEKDFIDAHLDVPPGWYASRAEALANWAKPAPMQQQPAKRKPGRPRKDAS